MNCPNCLAPLVEGAPFCEKCGVRIVNTGDPQAGNQTDSLSSSPLDAETVAAAQMKLTDPFINSKYNKKSRGQSCVKYRMIL